MDVVLEVTVGLYLGQYLLDDTLMVVQNLFQRIRTERVACQEIDELAERETTQVVACTDAVQLGILVFESHYTRACEDHFKSWATVIDEA